MTFKFPKHPNEMNPNELFDMVQQVQQQAKSQGQHYPMSTTRHPAPGTEATVNDMHVGATRQQLTDIFNRQKSTPPIAPAQPTQNNQTAGLVESAYADDEQSKNKLENPNNTTSGNLTKDYLMNHLPAVARTSLNEAELLNNAGKNFVENISAELAISKGKKDELLLLDQEKGEGGMLRSVFENTVSKDPERVNAYLKGYAIFESHLKNKRQK